MKLLYLSESKISCSSMPLPLTTWAMISSPKSVPVETMIPRS